MPDTRYKICIVTSTRADWGLLTPLATALRARPDVELQIVATNMHLIDSCGRTVSEIVNGGFTVTATVPMEVSGDDGESRARAMALCMDGMARVLGQLSPDCLIVLGDRYEILAVAAAASVMRLPIVHIAGGTVSEGAVDDSMRHAVTKLASLHLVETDDAAARVRQMGEDPARIVVTGALGVWNIMNQPLMTPQQLSDSIGGFALKPGRSLLVTYHPATLDEVAPADRYNELLAALDRFHDVRVLITYPNNDAGGAAIARLTCEYAAANPQRVKAVASLGMVRYLSALRCVDAVVGNSSSGIVEVPSMHIPTVDIGLRQRGRLCADSVLHCGDTADEIAEAIARALSPSERARAAQAVNPYYKPDTVRRMVRAIMNFMPVAGQPKHFRRL